MNIKFLGLIEINIWVFYAIYILMPLVLAYALNLSNKKNYSLIKHSVIVGSIVSVLVPIGWLMYGGLIDSTIGFPIDKNKGLGNVLYWVSGIGVVPTGLVIAILTAGFVNYFRFKKSRQNFH